MVILFLPVELFTQAQDVRVRDSLKYFVCFLLIFTQKKAGIDYGMRGKWILSMFWDWDLCVAPHPVCPYFSIISLKKFFIGRQEDREK